MRGTQGRDGHERKPGGIIPAYAGNTFDDSQVKADFGDHPRVCGEHIRNKFRDESDTGSSPRMRGTPEDLPEDSLVLGIIPAYAGNTAN